MQFEYNGLVAEFLMSSLYVTICRYASVSLPCNRPFYYSSLRPTYVLSRPIVRPTVRSSIDHPSVRPFTVLPTHRPTALLAYSHTILYSRSAFARPYRAPSSHPNVPPSYRL